MCCTAPTRNKKKSTFLSLQARTKPTYIHLHVCLHIQPDSITHTWCECKLQHTHTLAHTDTWQVHTYHTPASRSVPWFSLELGAKIRTRGAKNTLRCHMRGWRMGGGGADWGEGSGGGGEERENAEQAGMEGEERDLIKGGGEGEGVGESRGKAEGRWLVCMMRYEI